MKSDFKKLTSKLAALTGLVSTSAFMSGSLSAFAQSSYQNYPGWNNPPGMASQNAVNLPPSVSPALPSAPASGPNVGSMDFWKSFAANRIAPGTVFTGKLEDEVSSKHAKQGDIFAIVLEEGFSNQGNQVIPPGSKIIGTITGATPAKQLHFGMPGNVQVALQSITFPDGRTGPISGFIEHNPNHMIKDDANKSTNDKSMPLGDYTNSAKAMGYSLVRSMTRIGGVRYSPQAHAKAGNDFEIKKGEVLAVKLNRPLDLAALTYPTGSPSAVAPAPNAVPGSMAPFDQNPVPAYGAPGQQAGLPQNEPF
jgi:hypothetical protein